MGSNDSNSEDDVESLDFVQARNVIATEAALESTVRRETSTFDLFRLDLSLYTIQTIGCGPPTTPLGEKEERPIWQQGTLTIITILITIKTAITMITGKITIKERSILPKILSFELRL